jgi:hypothetical protein
MSENIGVEVSNRHHSEEESEDDTEEQDDEHGAIKFQQFSFEKNETVADLIMKALIDDGTVTPDELPISSAEKALRTYAYQHSNVTFDSRESTLRRR